MKETWVQFLGWADPLEKQMDPLQYSCLENPMDRGTWQATVHGVTGVGHNLMTRSPPRGILGFPDGSAVKNKKVKMTATQCWTLCNPLDCSPPSSSIQEILQARTLKWVTIPFSRGSSQPRDQAQVSLITSIFFSV